MRFLNIFLLAMAACIPSAYAEEQNSAADVILYSISEQITAWETSTWVLPTYRLRINYATMISRAEAADDGIYGPGSQYALDFIQRIEDDLQAWQNSAVPTVAVAELVPRLKRIKQAVELQVFFFGE